MRTPIRAENVGDYTVSTHLLELLPIAGQLAALRQEVPLETPGAPYLDHASAQQTEARKFPAG